MFVFKTFTSCVIVSLLFVCGGMCGVAKADWVYAVQRPAPPKTTKTQTLKNPSVAEIQNALADNTRINVVGKVKANNGDRLMITSSNVRLDFSKASTISWRGSDNWGGFLEISGSRVEVLNLKMKVAKNSGRCRGVIIQTPASDVRLRNCVFSNVSDGLIADGEWARVSVENTAFLKCNDWSDGGMAGGYGIFMEDDDKNADHLRLENVKVTLANSSDQHGIRISMVENILIDQCRFGANGKRSLWAYGVENVSIANTTFTKGSLLFNLKTTEWQTDRPVKHVRMWNCEINHDSILMPIAIYCGKGTQDFQMKEIDINSTNAPDAIEVGWRENGGGISKDIRWENSSIRFNGRNLSSKDVSIGKDWSKKELKQARIGAAKSLN